MFRRLFAGCERTSSLKNAALPLHRTLVARQCLFTAVQRRGCFSVSIRDSRQMPVSVERVTSFGQMDEELPYWLRDGIAQSGFKAPLTVQQIAMPLLFEGRDVIGIAPTGSGKTVAFAVPALAAIDVEKRHRNRRAEPSVLVLCPTRELCQQTHTVFRNLSAGAPVIGAAFGGSDRTQQSNFLSRGCEVLVATPGRLCDFMEDGVVSLNHVDFLVLDEADRMFEIGFTAEINHILQHLKAAERPRRTMMWSATWCNHVEAVAKQHMDKNTVTLKVNGSKTNKDIEQKFVTIETVGDRLRSVAELYRSNVITPQQQVVLFCKTKENCDDTAIQLREALRAPEGRVQSLHGGFKQSKRDAICKRFREGSIRILVASDVASRGLDFPAVDHVINYDLPNDLDTYTHRIGRTGRAGRKGTAHTIVSKDNVSEVVRDIARYLKKSDVPVPSELANSLRGVTFNHGRKFEKYQTGNKMSGGGGNWRDKPQNHHGGGGGRQDGGGGKRVHKEVIMNKRPAH